MMDHITCLLWGLYNLSKSGGIKEIIVFSQYVWLTGRGGGGGSEGIENSFV